MHVRKPVVAAGMLAGLIWAGAVAQAEGPVKFTGSLVGLVSDVRGVPQMGATVLLYNRYDRVVQRALTNEKGAFGFDSLAADNYSLRVTLNSFVPALKRNIAVQPGMRSFLEINLAGVLSSIELVYSAPAQGALMSDDWKWVLRSSLSTRPVMRVVPGIDISDPSRPDEQAGGSMFSETRGVFRVSAGDHGDSSTLGNQPDLGTAFALATSLFGSHQLQVSGNVGYASTTGMPATGFRTTLSRADSGSFSDIVSPDVQLTMRQVFLPARAGGAFLAPRGVLSQSAPALRTMSLAVHDQAALTDDVTIEYGFAFDNVTFVDRLNYLSPYGRLTYSLGDLGSLKVGYSSGAPPANLVLNADGSDADLQQDLSTLSLFPRLSLLDGRARVQRSENFEVGYAKVAGSRTFSAGVFRESVSNAALTIAGANGVLPASDLLPDIASNSSIFNVGSFQTTGYTASVTQDLNEFLSVTLAYGNGGVLRTEQRELQPGSPEELRALVRIARRDWAAARLSGMAPFSGTRFTTSYMWTDYRSLTPPHAFLTQSVTPQAGLNVSVRQPIPGFGGIPGRLEASADLRNLLAQGYLPIRSSDGRGLLLIHSPRAVRGGLSFIF